MKNAIKKTIVTAEKGRQDAALETPSPSVRTKMQPEGSSLIEKKNRSSPNPPATEAVQKLRVAAYSRVSTLEEEQNLSYETQCSYFKDVISANQNLELVGIYGDQGSSGLRMEERNECQRMIADCEAGKIDVIYTKSISRLARNAIDCQRILDKLHKQGVYVYFEKEDIQSNNPQFDLVLKFLSSVAQEESNGQSQSIKWVVDHNAAMGKPAYKCCYGYRKAKALIKDPLPKSQRHSWIIFEEEAQNVQLMFRLILQGCSSYEVAMRLTQMEREKGNHFLWKSCKVCGMLRNIAYKGDIQTHKTVVLDYLNGKAVPNEGYRDSYYIKRHHEPIITEENFDKVQSIMQERSKIWKEKRL